MPLRALRLRKALATIQAGDAVDLVIRRGGNPGANGDAAEQTVVITAGKGF